jgi:Rod binding domain-containing protein
MNLASLPLPPPAANGALQAKAWKAAQDFEAVALGAFLKPMFDTVDLSAGPFGGGEAEQTWQSMLVSELGKQMQRAGGLGIARSVYAEMLRMQEQASPAGRRRPSRLAPEMTPPAEPAP